MSTQFSCNNKFNALRQTVNWVQGEGLGWVYVFKAATAALLALWIAMRLELPSPRTAMTTVFIVMQPQSGMVLSKSINRFVGSIVGLVAMLAIIGFFSQAPVLFLLATGFWLAICTAGAARNRNFRSYGFVLAGYTAVLVGIPAAQQAPDAFITATTRLAEVFLGILCAGAVSALIFPQHIATRLHASTRDRFVKFMTYLESALKGELEPDQIEAAHTGFISDIIEFQAARAAAVLEDPEIRLRAHQFSRLNDQLTFMSTRLHALHRLVDRLRIHDASTDLEAVKQILGRLLHELPLSLGPSPAHDDVIRAAQLLSHYRLEMTDVVRASPTQSAAQAASPSIEVDTTIDLVVRFIDSLYAYLLTYASLDTPVCSRERWTSSAYLPRTNPWIALIAGIRAAVVMAALSVFWIASAWPSGGIAVLNGATICALAASSSRPTQTTLHMTIGTILAAIVGFIAVFGLYPNLDSFLMLAAGLIPILTFGSMLTTRRHLAGYGTGFCIYFCFLAGPDNLQNYDSAAYVNNACAVIVSMLVASLAFATFFPASTKWQKRMLLHDMRQQVVVACQSRPARLSLRFESATRDLLWQILNLPGIQDDARHHAFRWFFVSLEIGQAAICLRTTHDDALPKNQRSLSKAAQKCVENILLAIARVFDRPSMTRFVATISSITVAIDQLSGELQAAAAKSEVLPQVKNALAQIHFIHTTLVDHQCPIGMGLEP